MKYTSSITTKYGDIDNVKQDVKTLHDILARQGASLLIDVIAESCGETVSKFKLKSREVMVLRNALCKELMFSINERT
jgi:hypothetical protein